MEIEITRDYLPFFLQSVNVQSAFLAFTTNSADNLVIGNVEFDGVSVGTPMEDEQIGGFSVPLTITGPPPWKHKIGIAGIPANTRVWLLLQFGTS